MNIKEVVARAILEYAQGVDIKKVGEAMDEIMAYKDKHPDAPLSDYGIAINVTETDSCDCVMCSVRRAILGPDPRANERQDEIAKSMKGVDDLLRKILKKAKEEATNSSDKKGEDAKVEVKVHSFDSPEKFLKFIEKNKNEMPEKVVKEMLAAVQESISDQPNKRLVQSVGDIEDDLGNKLQVGTTQQGELILQINDQTMALDRAALKHLVLMFTMASIRLASQKAAKG